MCRSLFQCINCNKTSSKYCQAHFRRVFKVFLVVVTPLTQFPRENRIILSDPSRLYIQRVKKKLSPPYFLICFTHQEIIPNDFFLLFINVLSVFLTRP